MATSRPRAGFTLVELLVVITIIGVLVSLTAVALSSALASARRMQCQTHVRSLTRATLLFEGSKDRLPGYTQSFGRFTGTIDKTEPNNTYLPEHVKVGSWVIAVAPYMEQQRLWEHWDQDQYPVTSNFDDVDGYSLGATNSVSLWICPSDVYQVGSRGQLSYVANTGMFVPLSGLNTPGGQSISFARSLQSANTVFTNKYAGAASAAFPNGAPVGKDIHIEDFDDGSSQTLLITENVHALPFYSLGGSHSSALVPATPGGEIVLNPLAGRCSQGVVWHWEEPHGISDWAGSAPTVNPKHHVNSDMNSAKLISANAADLWDYARPAAEHGGVFNAGFADGSVRSISNAIDYNVYQSLLTPNNKQSDMPRREYFIDNAAN